MTSSVVIRQLVVAALTGTTDAGANVFFARTWPTQPDSYPILMIPPLEENGESWGPTGEPSFTVTTTLRVIARVQEPAELEDAGAAAVAIALETLRDQIKAAVINNPTLMGWGAPIQEFKHFRCMPHTTANGEQPIGEMVVEIDMVFLQSSGSDFYQIPAVPLQGVDVTVLEPDGTTEPGLTINLPQ
ncbi:ABC transporter permease [Caballeronia sp. dw_19]|uniref:ABC transporter permease n=1 Tax=Caballeronia sp. dw_19 TaxID=2719791 RepID=UPI001BCBE064|nr:ABC transporter permease [Caballeronia sp. dw_19]